MKKTTEQSAPELGNDSENVASAHLPSSLWDAWFLCGTGRSAAFIDTDSTLGFFTNWFPPVGDVVGAPGWQLSDLALDDKGVSQYTVLIRYIGDASIRPAHFGRYQLRRPHIQASSIYGPSAERPLSVQQAIHSIRYQTNLTWSQIAKALGVQARSLHYWVEGRPATGTNVERVMELMGAVNRVDAGDPDKTTRRLLEPRGTDPSIYMDFCERNGQQRVLSPAQFGTDSETELQHHAAFRPSDLIDALHDEIGSMEGEYVKTVRRTSQSE